MATKTDFTDRSVFGIKYNTSKLGCMATITGETNVQAQPSPKLMWIEGVMGKATAVENPCVPSLTMAIYQPCLGTKARYLILPPDVRRKILRLAAANMGTRGVDTGVKGSARDLRILFEGSVQRRTRVIR